MMHPVVLATGAAKCIGFEIASTFIASSSFIA